MKKYFKRLLLALFGIDIKEYNATFQKRNESIPGGGIKKPQKPKDEEGN